MSVLENVNRARLDDLIGGQYTLVGFHDAPCEH